MIVRMTGTLADVDLEDRTTVAHIERDGLVYAVDVPGFVARQLAPQVGQTITLHTLEYLEGNPTGGNLTPRRLGFLSASERAFFERFRTVKGIGPRKSLRAMNEPPATIAGWIEQSDTRKLATLPEIGKRLAETIVAELRGKMAAFLIPGDNSASGPRPASSTGPSASTAAGQAMAPSRAEAAEILIAWGDKPAEAEQALDAACKADPALAHADARTLVQAVYRLRARLRKA